MQLKTWLKASLGGLAFLMGQTAGAMADDMSWDKIVEKARGQTVYWNAWGGGQTYNDYIQWVNDRVSEDYGVSITHVKLQDTAEAVRTVLAEKVADQTSDGTVDLIWINGENFKSMKEQDLLHGPWAKDLPNWTLTDETENPGIIVDFTIPTDGFEAPWGGAQLIFIHDSETLKNPPLSADAILTYAAENPGRISFPAPPDFTGSSFLKQVLIEKVAEPDRLQSPVGDDFDQVTEPLWVWLDQIQPHLWREGKEYPSNEAQLTQMLDDGVLDLAMSFNVGAVPNAIKEGRLPETARSYVLENGTLGNVHFVAIPFNAKAKEGAKVVANFLMSPEAQARKMDPAVWGEPTILSYAKLAAQEKALFDAIEIGEGGLSSEQLGTVLSEPHASWMVKIEQIWLERYGS